MQTAEFVNSYAAIWSGIFLGMTMASLFYWLAPMHRRWWFGVFALVFLICAIGVRPVIYSMVVLP